MLYWIEANGFRSLTDFSLRISPGINVLVGPNGSGKTNIISLFDFLSATLRLGVAASISKLGGISAFFAKSETESGNFQKNVKITAIGQYIYKYDQYRFEDDKSLDNKIVTYAIDFEVTATNKFEDIYFSSQRMRISINQPKITRKTARRNFENLAWDFDLTVKNPDGTSTDVRFHEFNIDILKPYRIYYSEAIAKARAEGQSHLLRIMSERISDDIKLRMSDNDNIISIVSKLFPAMRYITDDFANGEVINVIPTEVKKPEFAARDPGIHADGTGLAATLHALKQGRFRRRRTTISPHRSAVKAANASFQEIVDLFGKINPAAKNLEIVTDRFDNTFKLLAIFDGQNGDVKIPISALSDGTVKWLSIVTAIITYKGIFAIEEPENYLHPAMQQILIELLRIYSTRRQNNSFVLISTHSETIINSANPEELILTRIARGRTTVRRPKNVELIKKEISESGFGLAFYYVSGGLDG